jgi:hypothetical protein
MYGRAESVNAGMHLGDVLASEEDLWSTSNCRGRDALMTRKAAMLRKSGYFRYYLLRPPLKTSIAGVGAVRFKRTKVHFAQTTKMAFVAADDSIVIMCFRFSKAAGVL